MTKITLAHGTLRPRDIVTINDVTYLVTEAQGGTVTLQPLGRFQRIFYLKRQKLRSSWDQLYWKVLIWPEIWEEELREWLITR